MKVVRCASPGGGWDPADGMAGTARVTGFDRCGGTWVAASGRRSPAPVRTFHHGASGRHPDARRPGKPAMPAGKSPLGRLAALQQLLAKRFAILENPNLSILLNSMGTIDISGSYNPWLDLKDTMKLPANSRMNEKPGLRTPPNNDTRITNRIQFKN